MIHAFFFICVTAIFRFFFKQILFLVRLAFCRFQCLRITGVADDLKQGWFSSKAIQLAASIIHRPVFVGLPKAYIMRFAFATSAACSQSCSETSRREKQETLATMYMPLTSDVLRVVIPRDGMHKIYNCTVRTFTFSSYVTYYTRAMNLTSIEKTRDIGTL